MAHTHKHTHYFNSLIKRGGHKKCVEITLTCEVADIVGVGTVAGAGAGAGAAIPQLPFTFYGNFTFTKRQRLWAGDGGQGRSMRALRV